MINQKTLSQIEKSPRTRRYAQQGVLFEVTTERTEDNEPRLKVKVIEVDGKRIDG